MSSAPPIQPAWAIQPVTSGATLSRPTGVTFAGILSIVLGGFGCLWGLVAFAFAGAFAVLPFVGPLFASFGVFFGILYMALGVFGIVAGAQALQGAMWARWALVAAFAMGTLGGLGTIVVPILDIIAIVMLMNDEASRWFEAQSARR